MQHITVTTDIIKRKEEILGLLFDPILIFEKNDSINHRAIINEFPSVINCYATSEDLLNGTVNIIFE